MDLDGPTEHEGIVVRIVLSGCQFRVEDRVEKDPLAFISVNSVPGLEMHPCASSLGSQSQKGAAVRRVRREALVGVPGGEDREDLERRRKAARRGRKADS
jgi:hypothetical protein